MMEATCSPETSVTFNGLHGVMSLKVVWELEEHKLLNNTKQVRKYIV
jgi:hypothetical protein